MLLIVWSLLAVVPSAHVSSFDPQQLERLAAHAALQPGEPSPLELELSPEPASPFRRAEPPFSRAAALTLSAGTLLLGGALLCAAGLGAFNRMHSAVTPSLAGAGATLVLLGPGLHYLQTDQPQAFLFTGALRVGAALTVLLLTAAAARLSPYSSAAPVVFTGGMFSLVGFFVWDLYDAWNAPRRWRARLATR